MHLYVYSNPLIYSLGWKYFGRIVADEVHALVPALSEYIVADTALSAAIANGTILPQDL